MSNGSVSRKGGKSVSERWSAGWRWALATLLLAVLPTYGLSAQVGHDPAHSPFRDVTTKQSVSLIGGVFFGNLTEAQVGAQQGPLLGVRLQTALSGPIDLILSGAYVQSQRYTVDPSQPPATRRGGPINYDLIIADLSIAVSLTGAKTWHGIAPYVSAGIGVVAPTTTVADPGGYKAGAGFTFTPAIGVRARLGRVLSLQIEGRDNTIRYEWPLSYFVNTVTPTVLNPATSTEKQLTHNFSVTLGLSYNFNF